jgi:hypothetical protein
VKTQIIVVKLGWVLVGRVSEHNGTLEITDAANVRMWGTERGLGQIAFDGPTKETKLDKMGYAIVERAAVLFRIDCEESKWKKHL